MGYHTDFAGEFIISPPLEQEHLEYLQAFAESRHIKMDEHELISYLNGNAEDEFSHQKVGLPIGDKGAYVIGDEVYYTGANKCEYSYAPIQDNLSSLYCQWVPTNNVTLEWDGGEKFYSYVEWLEFLIAHFFNRWGYSLNGEVKYDGEEREDIGVIQVINNIVTVHKGVLEIEPSQPEVSRTGPDEDIYSVDEEEPEVLSDEELLDKIREAKKRKEEILKETLAMEERAEELDKEMMKVEEEMDELWRLYSGQ